MIRKEISPNNNDRVAKNSQAEYNNEAIKFPFLYKQSPSVYELEIHKEML